MTSAINPNNIDTAYPVAGQDNDSQGFRDNFTNIKTNFQYAEDEITDLQDKVLLKSALSGTTLDNDMGGALLTNPKLQGVRYTRIAPTATSGTITVDFSAGQVYKVSTLTGNITLSFTNLPSAGNYAEWIVQLTQGSTQYTVTFPSAVSVGTSNLQGYASNVVTFYAAGTYQYKFSTSDGGTTIFVEDLSRNLDPIYLPSSEALAASGAANLGLTTSYFTTAATGETSTLAAGTTGQVKVLAYYAEGATGDTRIFTVTNAGWKSSGTGTVTFTEFGQTATLMYINSKWFVIGMGPGASDTLPTLA